MHALLYDTFTILFGEFSVAVTHNGALAATAFGDESVLRSRLTVGAFLRRDAEATSGVRAQVLEYFAGERRAFSLPAAPAGSAFQNQVWEALAAIPFGETRSYSAIAASLGRPGAARAVGRANATNPRCLVAPCHRVIGADGSLTGFAFGGEIKARLLDFERSRER